MCLTEVLGVFGFSLIPFTNTRMQSQFRVPASNPCSPALLAQRTGLRLNVLPGVPLA